MDPNQDTVNSVKGLLKQGEDDREEERTSDPPNVDRITVPTKPQITIDAQDANAVKSETSEDEDLAEVQESAPLSPARDPVPKFSYLAVEGPKPRMTDHLSLPSPVPGPMGDPGEGQITQRRVTFARKRDIVNIELDSLPGEESGPTSPKSTGSNSTESSDGSKLKCAREFKMKICIGLLFAFMVTGVTLIFHFYHAKQLQIKMGKRLIYQEKSRDIIIFNHQRAVVLEGILGLNLHQEKLPAYCVGQRQGAARVDHLCLIWKDLATLKISFDEEEEVSCYNVSWQSHNPDLLLQDCFSLNDSWYGAGLMYGQHWPLDSISLERTPFIAGTIHDRDSLGPVLEPYFLSSAGVSIMVDTSVPLHISMNAATQEDNGTKPDNRLCLYADTTDTPYPDTSLPHLSYTVCVAPDIASVHKVSLSHFTEGGHRSPDFSMYLHSVWSTSPYLRGNLTQQSVTEFVDHIVAEGYKRSMLIIDGDWEDTLGSFQFDPDRFPDPVSMIQYIHSHGFRVSLMIHPYLNYDSEAFQFGMSEELLVTDLRGQVPGLTKWWLGPPQPSSSSGIAAVVDVTSDGSLWLQERLNNLSGSLNLDSFYWFGGQADMQPVFPTFAGNISTPNLYLTHLAELGANISNAQNQLLQTSFKSQHVLGMVRLYGHQSSWTDNGLENIIPSVLSLGILGYPYVLPDVIGGNAYIGYPTKELYIRWLQLTTFLPSMHFSIPPDVMDGDTKRIAESLFDRHLSVVVPVIMKAASQDSLLPLIRPLWLQWPDDSVTYDLDTQFLVGTEILVAPVLIQGLRARDIYLPNGTWSPHTGLGDIHGPRWLKNFPVPINQIPYFILKH